MEPIITTKITTTPGGETTYDTQHFQTQSDADKALENERKKLDRVDEEIKDGQKSITGYDKDGNTVTVFNFEEGANI